MSDRRGVPESGRRPGLRLVILGKQGAGKGTQAERLAQYFEVPRISTGDLFRTSVRSGSEAGQRAKEFMDAGELVPDDVVIEVVRERLSHDDAANGFVLEGFPRTASQAECLDELLAPHSVDLVIELQVPTEVVLRRLANRRVCTECGTNYSIDTPPSRDWICDMCGGKVIERTDDTELAITRRLALYTEQTEPLVAYYLKRDKLAAVDGTGQPEIVMSRLLRGIEGRLGAA